MSVFWTVNRLADTGTFITCSRPFSVQLFQSTPLLHTLRTAEVLHSGRFVAARRVQWQPEAVLS